MYYKVTILIISFLTWYNLTFAQEPINIYSVYATKLTHDTYGDAPIAFFLEELNKRIKNKVYYTDEGSNDPGQIVLMSPGDQWPDGMDTHLNMEFPLPEEKEGYRIIRNDLRIYVQGRDQRGLQFGMGQILRESMYDNDMFWNGQSVSMVPDKAIRGHQIGYRTTANSYDAWTPDDYEQYIRDMIVFGANSIENIPFWKPNPIHFTISPDSMNNELGRICDKYDMDYWIWTPIRFDLNDQQKTAEYLRDCENLYRKSPRLNAVFVPGGDPGKNPPELVLPVMKKMGDLLMKYHPEARMWLSLQGFTEAQSQFVYSHLEKDKPTWMGGLVAGPSSPPLEQTRIALADQYQLRDYPDITHTVRCQYPNWWWDPVFNFTLGREPVNPQPIRYENIYHYTVGFIDGFVTYSDGMHDDLNKMVYSRLGMEPNADIRDIVREYANYFLHSPAADEIADGLFALETNWDGAVKYNGSITGTLKLWEDINETYKLDEIWEHWRWKMYLQRARYDAFVRERFIFEEQLEEEANEVMRQAGVLGSEGTIDSVRSILNRSSARFKDHTLRDQIYHLGDDLFEVIGYQTSVPLYHASNPERGAIIDFIDRPLNNEWWILDEFEKMETWSEQRKINRLKEMGSWEEPGTGGYYDDIGNIYRSPHVVKPSAPDTDPTYTWSDNPGFDWWEQGYSKARLAWMSSMGWPYALKYDGLDPEAGYVLRLSGVGDAYPLVDGKPLRPSKYGKETGTIKEFPIPKDWSKSGHLTITFREIDESHLNWRQHSRLNEAWLIKK